MPNRSKRADAEYASIDKQIKEAKAWAYLALTINDEVDEDKQKEKRAEMGRLLARCGYLQALLRSYGTHNLDLVIADITRVRDRSKDDEWPSKLVQHGSMPLQPSPLMSYGVYEISL